MTVLVDFPKVYINQLLQMIYPESFVVCFSAKNDDSAMWGDYAGQHKGVCLIYETDENQALRIDDRLIKAEKVVYGEGNAERDFFETFGRLTFPQIRRWLTGTSGISSCISAFENKDVWREKYWNAFNMKNYRKLASWAYEEEYRLVIEYSFYDYSTPETWTLTYDSKTLKGVIFGIRTSEYDKLQIVESLSSKTDLNKDFAFWQAEYDESQQRIRIRQKTFWKC